MPFTYLGVPICAKRISGNECIALAEKMTARIRTWSSRNLSFAARVVLINSVLMAIHAYWCQMLILPKKVIRQLESICKAFLWKGQACTIGPGLIAWESLCQSKTAGGLGFRKIHEWNQAAMGKYIFAIAQKQDNLWLKWINSVYLKEHELLSYKAPPQSSWTSSVVPASVGPLNTPKHSFISWLAIQGRLRTKDRGIKGWLSWHVKADTFSTLTRWIGRSKISMFRKNVLTAALVCLVYTL
uniref:Reverse transcriptase zinc-binding domain-containing protein n=1 Tax=Cannabis sativa TaxID=3483 RepID=A0A803Q327_CANSA